MLLQATEEEARWHRENPHSRTAFLIAVAVDFAGIHIGDCPCDNTCDCPGKEYNDLIQKTILAAQRLEPLEEHEWTR